VHLAQPRHLAPVLVPQPRTQGLLVAQLHRRCLRDARLLLELAVEPRRLCLELELQHPRGVVYARAGDADPAPSPAHLRGLGAQGLPPRPRALLLLALRSPREHPDRVALLLGGLEVALQALQVKAEALGLRRLARGGAVRLHLVSELGQLGAQTGIIHA
jgi:hypothetical protein